MAGEAYAFSEGYAGIGAVPDSRFGFIGVYYTRTPKERANGLGQTFVRSREAGRRESFGH